MISARGAFPQPVKQIGHCSFQALQAIKICQWAMQPNLGEHNKDHRLHTEHQCQAKEQAVVVAAAAVAVPPLDCQPAAPVSISAAVFHIANRLALGYLARNSVSSASCMKHTLERRDPGPAAF